MDAAPSPMCQGVEIGLRKMFSLRNHVAGVWSEAMRRSAERGTKAPGAAQRVRHRTGAWASFLFLDRLHVGRVEAQLGVGGLVVAAVAELGRVAGDDAAVLVVLDDGLQDRKSTRLNSSHLGI